MARCLVRLAVHAGEAVWAALWFWGWLLWRLALAFE